MVSISTSTPSGPVFLSEGREGVDATIRVENHSNQRIQNDQIVCEVSIPDGISIEIGNATRVADEMWHSVRDLPTGRRVSMPIFIDCHRSRTISQDSIAITLRIANRVSDTSELKLWL